MKTYRGLYLNSMLQVTDALNECSIAARLSTVESDLGAPVSAFSGQMGCIYLFEDILSSGEASLACTISISGITLLVLHTADSNLSSRSTVCCRQKQTAPHY